MTASADLRRKLRLTAEILFFGVLPLLIEDFHFRRAGIISAVLEHPPGVVRNLGIFLADAVEPGAPRALDRFGEPSLPDQVPVLGEDALLGGLVEVARGSQLRGTDDALKDLTLIKSLRGLYLGSTPVTDAGLKDLAGMNLAELEIPQKAYTDLGLKNYLAALRSPTGSSLERWRA